METGSTEPLTLTNFNAAPPPTPASTPAPIQTAPAPIQTARRPLFAHLATPETVPAQLQTAGGNTPPEPTATPLAATGAETAAPTPSTPAPQFDRTAARLAHTGLTAHLAELAGEGGGEDTRPWKLNTRRLEFHRVRQGLTKTEAGKRAGFGEGQDGCVRWYQYESGYARASGRAILRMAKALKVRMEDICGDAGPVAATTVANVATDASDFDKGYAKGYAEGYAAAWAEMQVATAKNK